MRPARVYIAMRDPIVSRMDEQPTNTRPEVGSIEELRKFLRDFDTAMLVTHTPEGLLRGRPMAVQDPAEVPDCDLWFVTADDSAKTDEIREEQQVNVSCIGKDGSYVSISATARIDSNSLQVRKLWKSDWKIWLPDEPADGSIALLKLTVERAEYWHPEGGRLRVLYSKVKELFTGEHEKNAPKRIP
jgi:general stress protein 26